MIALAIHPDGRKEPLELPEGDARLDALQGAVGGWIAYFPEGFHEPYRFEVVHLDDWCGQPVNHEAGRMIGLPSTSAPLQGSVVIVPLPDGQNNRAKREHQRRYFGMLDAVDTGFCTAVEAGIGVLTRVDAA
ncbi:DUF3846 domain-containing protein [Deinococcus sp. QL22]|uniref:DUF3846 domain-containing protein n=1 Tax=Deinococcus sp. QL22 TaxID=2939437 RepID=UPI002017AE8F|nr:DUF3846 domain-containing protein [Deinococcus sp. QL22]UQN09271.1 DUF3846 domain-containing protein [Deinococcus sp. QL22]